jgi:hypothetical protein
MWAMGKEAKPNHPGLGKLELALLNGFVITARVAIAYCLRTPPGGNTTMMRLGCRISTTPLERSWMDRCSGRTVSYLQGGNGCGTCGSAISALGKISRLYYVA